MVKNQEKKQLEKLKYTNILGFGLGAISKISKKRFTKTPALKFKVPTKTELESIVDFTNIKQAKKKIFQFYAILHKPFFSALNELRILDDLGQFIWDECIGKTMKHILKEIEIIITNFRYHAFGEVPKSKIMD